MKSLISVALVCSMAALLTNCRSPGTSGTKDSEIQVEAGGQFEKFESKTRIHIADAESRLPTGHEVWFESNKVYYRSPNTPTTEIEFRDKTPVRGLFSEGIGSPLMDTGKPNKYFVHFQGEDFGNLGIYKTVQRLGKYTAKSDGVGSVESLCAKWYMKQCNIKMSIIPDKPKESWIELTVLNKNLADNFDPDIIVNGRYETAPGFVLSFYKGAVTCIVGSQFALYPNQPINGKLDPIDGRLYVTYKIHGDSKLIYEPFNCQPETYPGNNSILSLLDKLESSSESGKFTDIQIVFEHRLNDGTPLLILGSKQ